MMACHLERIVPDEVPPGILALHLARYNFARPFCADRRILDVACGVGYGAQFLAARARRVVAVDLDWSAIAFAKRRYDAPNLSYHVADCGALGLRAAQFDVVCSFETIEHVADAEMFLFEVTRILRPDGLFVVSTPRVARTTEAPENPFHRREWAVADFERLLQCYFGAVRLYGQSRQESRLAALVKRCDVFKLRAQLAPLWLARAAARAAGSHTMADTRLDEVRIVPDHFDGAMEILAVAGRPRLRSSIPGPRPR